MAVCYGSRDVVSERKFTRLWSTLKENRRISRFKIPLRCVLEVGEWVSGT